MKLINIFWLKKNLTAFFKIINCDFFSAILEEIGRIFKSKIDLYLSILNFLNLYDNLNR